MSITNSQKAVLLGFLGVVAAAIAIIYFAKPNVEDMQRIQQENAVLEDRLADLQRKQANRDAYLAETEEYQKKFEDMLDAFPADLNQEISIMFVKGIREDYDFDVASLGLGQKEQFYTLGLGGGDASLGDVTPAEGEEGATEEAAPAADLAVGSMTNVSGYECYRANFPITYSGGYSNLKDVVGYVNNYPDRMTISTIDIAYNAEDDIYSGSMSMMCYAIESPDRPERKIELNEVEIGVDNIFQGGDGVGGGAGASDLHKYDENDGAAIVNDYDFYAMLNPSTGDVSAKIVGQNGAGKEASVISNSDNTESTLSFEFYEKDGKNYCKYTLDNSTSYEAEVTSAEDIKLLVRSSARKDSDDKVAIRITINNATSLPVYVKISDDDAASARVKIASKTGSVKVYK